MGYAAVLYVVVRTKAELELVCVCLRLATFLTATDAVDTGEGCSEL